MRDGVWLVTALLALSACGGGGDVRLFVDLRTDLLPVVEFATVDVTADGSPVAEASADPAASYTAGVRLVTLDGLRRGPREVDVTLRGRAGERVAGRRVILDQRATRGLTIVIPRDCRGVSCPGEPASTCVHGQCADATCVEGGGETCGPAECASDDGCAPPATACAVARCVLGTCLFEPASACAPGESCVPEAGCVADESVDPVSLGPFGPEEPLSFTEPGDDDPTLTADQLELYFNRGSDVWRSTREVVDEDWGAPTRVDELSTDLRESNPEVAPDGLTITLARAVDADLDVFVATRPNRAAAWGEPAIVAELSTDAEDSGAVLDASRTTLVLHRRPGDGADGYDLFVTTRAHPGLPWDPTSPAPFNDPASEDLEAHLGPAARVLYFASARGLERSLYVTSRASRDEPFGEPVPVPGVVVEPFTSDPWVSADQRVIYFARGDVDETVLLRASR